MHVQEELLWAANTVMQRSFAWGDARAQYVMIPYLDLINHRPGVDNNYFYDDINCTALDAPGAPPVYRMPSSLAPAPGLGAAAVPLPCERVLFHMPPGVVKAMTFAADANRTKGEPLHITYTE